MERLQGAAKDMSGLALRRLVLAAAVIALVLVWRTNGNLPFAATIIWALVAIAVAGIGRGANDTVIAAALLAAAATATLAFLLRSSSPGRWKSRRLPQHGGSAGAGDP